MRLYKNQNDAYQCLSNHFANNDFAMLTAQTGAGKTYVGVKLACMYQRVLVLVPSTPSSCKEKWVTLLAEVGRSDITVMTYRQFTPDDIQEEYDFLICDEVHLGKNKLKQITFRFFKKMLAISATPLDKSAKDLSDLLNMLIGIDVFFDVAYPRYMVDRIAYFNFIFKYRWTYAFPLTEGA